MRPFPIWCDKCAKQNECHIGDCVPKCYEPKTEPQTEDLQDWKDRMWTEAVIESQTENK